MKFLLTSLIVSDSPEMSQLEMATLDFQSVVLVFITYSVASLAS